MYKGSKDDAIDVVISMLEDGVLHYENKLYLVTCEFDNYTVEDIALMAYLTPEVYEGEDLSPYKVILKPVAKKGFGCSVHHATVIDGADSQTFTVLSIIYHDGLAYAVSDC